MKKHLLIITLMFSVINAISASIGGDFNLFFAWGCAAFVSLDHLITLNNL